jgi:signal transduction histidine kinase/CheY-like chemotaxis protein
VTSQSKRSPETFELLDKLGEGAMGQVYKAIDSENGETVAIKFLLPGADQRSMDRLRVEAQEHASLHHPNIVKLIDFLSYEDHDFLVMEYMDGGNLKEFLSTSPEIKEVLNMFAQACAGLDYIHNQGLVHRDLKPENLLLNKAGELKIADLGMVRRTDSAPDHRLTSMGQLVGSTYFMAPEQILRSEVTPSADLYAIGVTMYEAITGELPFTGSEFAILNSHIKEIPANVKSKVPTVPDSLDELIANLLEKTPESRPRSAGQVREKLLAIIGDLQHPEATARAKDEGAQNLDVEEMSSVILSMSRTFRNSMNGVLGMAHLLESATLSQEHRKYLMALKESAEHLQLTFGDLLDFARIRAGRLRLEEVATNLRGLIQNVLDRAQKLAKDQESALFSHVDVDVPDTVMVDPLRLNQILTNIVHHALTSSRGASVSILLQRDHDDSDGVNLRFSVTDSVSTLNSQETRQVFLPPSGDQADSRLDLYLTNHLVTSMGGRCWVHSAAGRGTTYTATLKTEVCGEMPTSAGPAQMPSLSILMADDQRVNQALAKGMLSVQGHKVKTVFNGFEVLTALESEEFDLILMDMLMPGMDGITAIRAIREQEKSTGKHIPIIALTALDLESMPDDEGAIDAYVAKPFRADALATAIAEAIRKHRPVQRLSPFEPRDLLNRVGGSQRHAEMMVQVFLETHMSQLQELDQAFRKGEIELVIQSSNHLYSALTGICANPSARAAQSVEQLARESRLEAALHARRQLLNELEYLEAALKLEFPLLFTSTASH